MAAVSGDRRAGLRQITDTAAIALVIERYARNPAQLADTATGQYNCSIFLGQVLKATAGKANPAQPNERCAGTRG